MCSTPSTWGLACRWCWSCNHASFILIRFSPKIACVAMLFWMVIAPNLLKIKYWSWVFDNKKPWEALQDEAFVCDKQARLEGNIIVWRSVSLARVYTNMSCSCSKLCRFFYAAKGFLFHEHSNMSMLMVDLSVPRAHGFMGINSHQNEFSNHKQKRIFIHAKFWCLKIGFLSNLKHNR